MDYMESVTCWKSPETLTSLTLAGDCTVTMRLHRICLQSAFSPHPCPHSFFGFPSFWFWTCNVDLLFPLEGKARMDSSSKLRIYGGLLITLLLWPTP